MKFSIRLGAMVATSALMIAAAHAQSNEITISVIHSQTGPIAFLGVPAVNAIRMAADELNEKKFLGDTKIKLIVNDDATQTAQTQQLINRAALQDNALMILGPSDSTRSAAVAPLINQFQIPTITTAQSAAAFAAGPWVFKVTADPVGAIKPLGEYAAQKLGLKRVATIFYRDNDGQIANTRTFVAGVKAAGAEIVAEEGVLSSETDYTAVATKIAALKPDGIFLGANAEQAANMTVAMRNAGVPEDIKFFGSSSLGEDYIKQGGKATDNTYNTSDWNPQSTTALNIAFRDNYKKRYNTDANNWAAVGYDSMMVAAAAIKAAGPNPTREKVRDALARLKDVPVVMGSGTWNNTESRIPEYGITVNLVKDGKITAAPQ